MVVAVAFLLTFLSVSKSMCLCGEGVLWFYSFSLLDVIIFEWFEKLWEANCLPGPLALWTLEEELKAATNAILLYF